MKLRKIAMTSFGAATALLLAASAGFGHGDVQPQPVDTAGLDPIGTEWAEENPYRVVGGDQYERAIKIGSSGYNQNCARCHGLEVISGGIAPDLRYLEDGIEGDEWFLQRIRHGYSQNGTYKMPPFEGILSQEAMWAIRSYVETRPED